MSKNFFDVFPTLQLPSYYADLFGKTVVEHVRYTTDRQNINIYLTSDRLLEKKSVFFVENQIEQQLFFGKEIGIHIQETFHLSSQYTLPNLIDAYKESILDEFKKYSEIEYNLLRKAEWVADGDLKLVIPDGMIVRSRQTDMVNHIQKILTERCGIDARVRVELAAREKKEDPNHGMFMVKRAGKAVDETEPAKVISENEADSLPWDSDEGAVAKKNGKDAVPSGGEPKEMLSSEQAVSGSGDNKADQAKDKEKSGAGQKNENGYRKKVFVRKQADPDVFYGREVEGEIKKISDITLPMGRVVVKGNVFFVEEQPLNSGKTIFKFSLTDYSDSIVAKIFATEDEIDGLREKIHVGANLIVKGDCSMDKFDHELEIGYIDGIKPCDSMKAKRVDLAETKRVELHLHTQMSESDGVSDLGDMIHLAKSWGHKAMAVTDHGVVYGFPIALHTLQKDKDKEFKMIYGMEGYLVDDTKSIVENLPEDSTIAVNDCCVVFDLETTGFSTNNNTIIEIGAVKVQDGKIIDRFSTFVNPKVPIPYRIEELTHINDAMVLSSPELKEVLPQFLEFCSDAKYLVAHNANFDVGFIEHNARVLLNRDYRPVYLDTVSLARFLLPYLNNFKLDTLAKELAIPPFSHHRAVDDAEATSLIYLEMMKRISELYQSGLLRELNDHAEVTPEQIMKLPTFHIILLAKNEIGRVNLYKLVSESQVKYFRKSPRIPRSLITKYREGLIVGSACEAGELFRSVLRGEGGEIISKIVDFYDYLEIQPIGNNRFLLKDEEGYGLTDDEDLRNLNREIVRLGEQFNKPVVATCDVHFMNPEDEVYRRIIMAGKGFKDADQQAPLYLRTTDEMLAEFDYLGFEKAYEVVVTNTNRIADQIDRISPVRPDKCPPVIENSDGMLRDICYQTAHEMYGENLPDIVKERLDRELNSIISNGYAVMYMIAQKLVKKSNDDGYLVGSRGSVGSSFAATMAGITEVNPLSPHYLCKQCFYVDFDSDEVKAFSGGSGCDMPDRYCPNCGSLLVKQGFDIPFETFLGFKGNKEPDIDLNFSGEYQSKAHDYTEVIFGAGQTFRAGTIGALADKTAYGLVKKYMEERGITKRECEINRIAIGCTGVRRTSGQHPGGIIVLPMGEDICTFTPVQHPANDMTTSTITTHFDYHSIDHNLLKLDILGHDDPTMIKVLEELTQMDMKTVPLDSKEVMSLFMNTEALGVEPKDLWDGCRLGALGIPEFGTDFAMQMLIDASPTKFSDLIRIAGLAHGTDVWLGNAQTLILEGTADISTAICTRDDIMIYLIGMGLESELSFTIMEGVRKGKGLKPEWEEEMIAHGVPDWYIWSCKKIKYMFPKAHAAAYVMMAWRIAWCKVFRPLAYYAAYFSIRATAFSYEIMCKGKDFLEHKLGEYRDRMDTLSAKEKDQYKDMRIVQEMYARGFEFTPIDIYKAKATRFQIVDGKIMPSFASIEGLGGNAAEGLEIAASKGEFLSQEDLRERSKITSTAVDKLAELGLISDLTKSNQISLFDFM